MTVETADPRAAYSAKAVAELADADASCPGSGSVRWCGEVLGDVVLVKGSPSEADVSAGVVLAGEDGEAAKRAFEALGVAWTEVFATCSRPSPESFGDQRALRLGLQIEAVDPFAVVALDAEAAADVADATGVGPLAAGEPVRWAGRTFLAVEGLEASLTDARRKARVWSQLRRLRGELRSP